MKVLLDARMRAGGVGRYVRDLRAGFDAIDSADLEPIFLESATPRPFTPTGRFVVGRRARAMGADLVHGLHFEAPANSGRPVVVTMPDAIPLDHPPSMPGLLRRTYFRRVLLGSARRAAALITSSRISAESLVRHGVPASKLRVVPLAVDEVFGPGSPDESAAARRRFANGSHYVVAVAEDRPHKNLAALERVALSLAGSGTKVLCRGPVPRGTASVQSVPRLSDEDLRSLYVGADVFVMTSLVEGFGLPLVEAAACGIPVVCGERVGAGDYLDGVVVTDVTDPSAIADAVLCLVRERDEGKGLGERLSRSARARTVRAMAEETIAVYREVLS